MAETLGGYEGLQGLRGPRPDEILRPGDVPLPVRQDSYGPRPELLHRRRYRALQEDEALQRPASDGLGLLRPPRRKRRRCCTVSKYQSHQV